MKSFLKVMKALSDPNRVKIIKLLQQKMMCVCEMQSALKIAQPTVSKHLENIRRSRSGGLCQRRSVGELFSGGRSEPAPMPPVCWAT